VHLAETVVVRCLVVDRNLRCVLFACEDDALRGALEHDVRCAIGDRFDRGVLRLRDHDLTEPRDDAELHGLGERPASDDLPGAVVDERNLRGTVGEKQATARVDGRSANGEERTARELDVLVRDHAPLLHVEIVGWARADLRIGEPCHAERRDAATRDEDIEAFDDTPRIRGAGGDVRCDQRERDDAEHGTEAGRAAHDALTRKRCERSRDVELGELRRRASASARPNQGERADRAACELGLDRSGHAMNRSRGIPEDPCFERAQRQHHAGDDDQDRERAEARGGRPRARNEHRDGRAETDRGDDRSPAWSPNGREPRVA
jgi:hypothetical protein